MKRKSLFAIFTAMALLSGCNSGSVSTVESAPDSPSAGTSSTAEIPSTESPSSVAAVDSEPSGTPAAGTTTVSTSGEASSAVEVPVVPTATESTAAEKPVAPEGVGGAGEPSDTPPETSAAVTTAATRKPDAPAATVPVVTTVPTVHSDPVGDDYKPTDIGGTGRGDDGTAKAGGIVDDFFYEAEDIVMDGAMLDGAIAEADFAEPDCCPIPTPEPPYTEPQIPPQAGLLTGGEWRDNDNWDFWQSLYGSENYSVDWEGYRDTWRTGADFRLEVTVKDSAGNAVDGARVVTDEPKYSAVTDNHGKAYLFYSQDQVINGFTELTVTFGDITASEKLTLGSDDSVEITLDSEAHKPAKTLDFMIMCDTTGSMWDELDYLKEELEDVVTRIKQENANIPTRLSVNFYRDEGDEYVVREFPFTTDLDAAVNAISEQSANGGGDTPEAVHTALNSAINSHDWDEDSIKIMFLVLDAPPHEDIQIIDETVKLVKQAAEKGIRIIPVASSGIDKSTEYLLRSMAFMTGGTYAFLTDDSGIGGDHIEPTIGSYEVEKLNDMMVRITGEYLD